MTWVYWYYWPFPLLKYRKRPSMSAMLHIKFENNKSIIYCSYNLFLFYLVWLWQISIISPFHKQKKIIFERIWGVIHTNKLYLAFSYCNLFFRMITNMKRWRDAILQKNPVHFPCPITDIQAHIPAWLTNQITGLAKIFHPSRLLLNIPFNWQ